MRDLQADKISKFKPFGYKYSGEILFTRKAIKLAKILG